MGQSPAPVSVSWLSVFGRSTWDCHGRSPFRGPAEVEREVTLRGGPNDVAPTLSFFVYAKAKSGGAVRLLAQFPQSGEAHASEQDWLQVKAPPGVTVVATSGDAVVVFDAGGSQTLSKGTWKVFAARGSAEDARKKPSVGVLVVEP